MSPYDVIIPCMLIGIFEMFLAFFPVKQPKKKYPAASKPKKGEIKRYVYMDEIEKSIS